MPFGRDMFLPNGIYLCEKLMKGFTPKTEFKIETFLCEVHSN